MCCRADAAILSRQFIWTFRICARTYYIIQPTSSLQRSSTREVHIFRPSLDEPTLRSNYQKSQMTFGEHRDDDDMMMAVPWRHDDDMMVNGRQRRRIRRYSLIALSCWPIVAFISVGSIEGVFSRRRLAQLLRGGASDISTRNDSLIPSHQHNVSFTPQSTTTRTTVVTVPLHATTGTHHVFMNIGSPPQRQTLIVDTGSRLLAFPCHPCRGCGRHASKFYNHDISTTAVIPKCGSCYLNVSKCSDFSNHCVVTQKYTEGSSWTGTSFNIIVMCY